MSKSDALHAIVKKVLPEVQCVIAWGAGPDPLHNMPVFIDQENDIECIQADFLSVHNTALFLPDHKGEKVAILAKGCDARSIGQLLAEKLINRDEIVVIGFPCEGVIDYAKVEKLLGVQLESGSIENIEESADHFRFTFQGVQHNFPKSDISADKCLRCTSPNAHIADHFVGEKRAAPSLTESYADLEKFEELSLEERQEFWEKEMSRCIRCYACRNACPLCVCREHCVASSRNPAWLNQADTVEDKLFFQIIHASHLAGRCTGCGECQRACPVCIPVLLFKRGLNRSVEKLFSYRAGIDEGTPPLFTFSIEEPTIKERDW